MTAMSFRENSATLAVIPKAMPARAGIGLRAPHYRELLERLPDIGWCEVHSENYFGEGGQSLYFLERARERYPLSLHGVGMSLGSTDALDPDHLGRLKSLIDRVQPALVSDVWALYRDAIARFGKIPTLIEWDAELPALDVLLDEANKADRLLEDRDALAA